MFFSPSPHYILKREIWWPKRWWWKQWWWATLQAGFICQAKQDGWWPQAGTMQQTWENGHGREKKEKPKSSQTHLQFKNAKDRKATCPKPIGRCICRIGKTEFFITKFAKRCKMIYYNFLSVFFFYFFMNLVPFQLNIMYNVKYLFFVFLHDSDHIQKFQNINKKVGY